MNVYRVGANAGMGFTEREYQRLKAQALMKQHNQEIIRSPISQGDIDYLNKVKEAPDVDIFLKLV